MRVSSGGAKGLGSQPCPFIADDGATACPFTAVFDVAAVLPLLLLQQGLGKMHGQCGGW